MLIQDMLSAGHGRALLSIENKRRTICIGNAVLDEKLSVRETEKLVKSIFKSKEKKGDSEL